MGRYFQETRFLILVVSLIGCGLPLSWLGPKSLAADTCNHIDNVLIYTPNDGASIDSVAVARIVYLVQDATATRLPYQTPFPYESPGRNENAISERVQNSPLCKKSGNAEPKKICYSHLRLNDNRSHAPPDLCLLSFPQILNSIILLI